MLDIYNRPRDFRSTSFLGFLQFSQKLQKIQRRAIPHLKALIIDINMLKGQGRFTIRDKANPLNLKKQDFQEKWAWQALEGATPLSFCKFITYYQGYKMTYCGSLYHFYFLRKLSLKLEFVNFRNFTL